MLLGVLPQLPVPLAIDMPMDARVLAFTLILSFGAALVSGLAPALQASRADVVRALKSDSAGSGTRLRLRSAFLVGQVALSLLLVLTAGLFLRALGRAASMNPGFDATNVDVAMLDLSLARYTPVTGPGFSRDLLARASAQPGVVSAALAIDLPLDGGNVGLGSLKTPGIRRRDSEAVSAHWNAVSPGYFRTLNLPLARGRDFTDGDVATAPKVAIVNETLARAAWGTADAVGRTIQANYTDAGWEPVTIVGVATDARVQSLSDPAAPLIYVPLTQRYVPRVTLLVKTNGASAIPFMRTLVRELNPDLPVTQAMTLSDVNALELIPLRIVGAAAGAFGVVGLLLAAIGIYGVSSYNVTQRVREIGIRVALGADRRAVLRLVLRQGALLTGIGVAIGLAAGAIVAQVVRSLLFGIDALDAITFAGGAALFFAVALAATLGPARRATRVDPMIALRAE
jgi:predicted permease